MLEPHTPRAARYLATLGGDDPLARADALTERAWALQDEGKWDEAGELLAEAEALLAGERP